MANKNKNSKKIIPESNKAHKKRVGRIVASVLAVSALAGGLTFCLTNDRVKTWLGIGSEVIETETKDDAEIKDLKSKINVLEDSVKILKEDKEKLILERDTALRNYETAVEERDAFKSQLDAEKELTEEQQTRLTELETRVESTQNALTNAENALAEKEALISNLENQISILQQQLAELQDIVNEYTNSVKERVSTYEMKYDTTTITNVFKDEKKLFLASKYSVELLDFETNEQIVLADDLPNMQNSKCFFYKVNNDLFVIKENILYLVNLEEKKLEIVSSDLYWQGTTTSNFNENYKILSSNFKNNLYYFYVESYVNNYRNLIYKDAEGNILVFSNFKYSENDNEICFAKSTNQIYKLNKNTLNLETFETGLSGTSTIYRVYNIDNLVLFCANSSSTKIYALNIEDGTIKTLSITGYLYSVFSFNSKTYFVNGSNNLYEYDFETNTSTLIYSSVGTSFKTILNVNETPLLIFSSKILRYVDGNFELVSGWSSYYTNFKLINGHIFDDTFSYVYNEETGNFQLALSSASINNRDKFLVHNGTLILTYQAKYFDETTLTFKDFEYELSDYTDCNYYVQQVNGKLFCSSNSTSVNRKGVFYIDLETKTIKKVPDSGNGDILSDGCYFQSSISVNENMALFFKSSYNYAILVNTDLMQVEDVFTNFSSDTVLYKNLIISHLGNYIKVFNCDTLEMKTIYSKENTGNATGNSTDLYFSYVENDKVYFSTKNAGTNVILNLNDFSVSYEYGLGNIEIDTLKLGLHSSASTLYDPSTGDLVHIKGLSSTPTLYDFGDSVMFINGTMVYSVQK